MRGSAQCSVRGEGEGFDGADPRDLLQTEPSAGKEQEGKFKQSAVIPLSVQGATDHLHRITSH